MVRADLYHVRPMGMSVSRKRLLVRGLVVVLVLYVGFAGFIGWAMRQPPETFGRVMAHMPNAVFLILPFETFWTHARAGQLHPGDAAPDFSLLKLDKSERIQLSSLTARQPVVLVFGSYT
jgi:hypothetical protein